ncbi:MAG: histidine phosphatase family protein [Bacteroidota bacterium]
MSRIYFIRHGQASYLSNNYDKLSKIGESQSKELGKYFNKQEVRFDKLYVGPLERQRRTLEISHDHIYNNGSPKPSVTLLHEMREHDGPKALKIEYKKLVLVDDIVRNLDDEIKQKPELKRKNSLKIFEHFIVKWTTGQYHVDHPEVQPWMDFRNSVRQGLDKVLTEIKRGDTVGVYTSGGTISALIAETLGIHDQAKVAELNFLVRNTSITQFEYSQGKFNLLSFNELPHLPKELITYV